MSDPMKGHLFFNTWCAASMLAELLENVDTDMDIIIVDRGIFDALVWLTLQAQRGELTKTEQETIEKFLLLGRWRSLIDLAVVMRVDSGKAMEREVAQRITNKTGSVMNPAVLERITAAVKDAITNYGNAFNRVIDQDTTDSPCVRQSNVELAQKILNALEDFANPEILVVPRAELEKLPLSDGGAFSAQSMELLKKCLAEHSTYLHRAEAEANTSFVQIVASGVLTHDEQVFIFQRKDADPKSKLYGRTTIWQGTHVARSPDREGVPLLESALMARLTRSLFLSREFKTAPIGYCWDKSNESSAKHFGVLFKIDIDNPYTADDLRKKEFRKSRGRGHDLIGQFTDWSEVERREDDLSLEPWSVATLKQRASFAGGEPA